MQTRERNSFAEHSIGLKLKAFEALRKIPMLAGCKDIFLEQLAQNMSPRFVAPDDVIAQQGEEVTAIFFLRRGAAEGKADMQKTEEFRDGSIIGNPQHLAKRCQWPYTVKSNGLCDLLSVTAKDFRTALEMYPDEAKLLAQWRVRKPSTGGLPFRRMSAPACRSPLPAMKALANTPIQNPSDFDDYTGPYLGGAPRPFSPPTPPSDAGSSPRRATAPSPLWLTAYAEDGSDSDGAEHFGRSCDFGCNYGAGQRGSRPMQGRKVSDGPSPRSSVGMRTSAKPQAKKKSSTVGRPSGAGTQVRGNRCSIKFQELDAQEALHNWAFAVQEQTEASMREIAAWLDTVPFFNSVDAFVFERILPLCEKRTFKKDQKLLIEGTPTEALHVIYAGYVHVRVGEQIVNTLGPKSIVGERAIVLHSKDADAPKSNASVLAATTVVVSVAIPRRALLEMEVKDPWLIRQLEKQFAAQKQARGELPLTAIELFRQADQAFTTALELAAWQKKFVAGDLLMREGEESTEAYLIMLGSVMITIEGEEMAKITVPHMSEAVIVGEFSLLGLVKHRTATVTALEECRVHIITRDALITVLDDYPEESRFFRDLVTSGKSVVGRRGTHVHQTGARAQHDRTCGIDIATQDSESEDGSDPGGDSDSPWLSAATSAFASERLVSAGSKEQNMVASSESSVTAASVEVVARAAGGNTTQVGGAVERPPAIAMHAAPPKRSTKKLITRRASIGQLNDQVGGTSRAVVPCSLSHIADFNGVSRSLLKKLEKQQQLGLFPPRKRLLRQGEDMSDIWILQKGSCDVVLYGDKLPPLHGPCIIGGLASLMTWKAFADVTTAAVCFTATISKKAIAQILDGAPDERTVVFQTVHEYFDGLCVEYVASSEGGLQTALGEFPLLKSASGDFVKALAGLVESKLLLPGQVVISAGNDISEQAKLYFLFDGYCHMLADEVVVGTISSKMVFGEMEIFGVHDDDIGYRRKFTTVEICRVGAVGRNQLFGLFERFPEERQRFERLVHMRLEDTVMSRVVQQRCFEQLPSPVVSEICLKLERVLYLADVQVVKQGDVGDSLLIVNRGKLDIFFNGIVVGMLWAGKQFGSAQLLGVDREYHASVHTKRTSHLLQLSRRRLGELTSGGRKQKRWLAAWRERAKVGNAAERTMFRRKYREHRDVIKSGARTLMLGLCGNTDKDLEDMSPRERAAKRLSILRAAFAAWQDISGELPKAADYASENTVSPASGSKQATARAETTREKVAEASVYFQPGKNLMFSRGLQKVELDVNGSGVCVDTWKIASQSGRLDLWRGVPAPTWLAAVREEIPKQLTSLKKEARGRVADLIGGGGGGTVAGFV